MKTNFLPLNLQSPLSMLRKEGSFKYLAPVALLLAINLSTVACRFNADSTNPAGTSQSQSLPQLQAQAGNGGSGESTGGGIDSSGGDLIRSTRESVEEALQNLNGKFTAVLNRLSFEFVGTRDSFISDDEKNVYDLLRKTRNGTGSPLEAITDHKIIYQIQDEPCQSSGGELKDGSAFVDSRGQPTVCLSKEQLLRSSPDSLQLDILALVLHEVSHLYGYDEAKAQSVQHYMIEHESLVLPNAGWLLNQSSEAFDLMMDYYDWATTQYTNDENGNQRERSFAEKLQFDLATNNNRDLPFPMLSTRIEFFVGHMLTKKEFWLPRGLSELLVRAQAEAWAIQKKEMSGTTPDRSDAAMQEMEARVKRIYSSLVQAHEAFVLMQDAGDVIGDPVAQAKVFELINRMNHSEDAREWKNPPLRLTLQSDTPLDVLYMSYQKDRLLLKTASTECFVMNGIDGATDLKALAEKLAQGPQRTVDCMHRGPKKTQQWNSLDIFFDFGQGNLPKNQE